MAGSPTTTPDADASGVRVRGIEAGIAVVVLDRPRQRNGLSLATIRALHEAFRTLDQDARVRAILLSAEGPAFCSGHDLKELRAHRSDGDRGAAFFDEAMQACAAMMQGIVACRKPVIAAVEGVATAAGCQLVATCDLGIAGAAARFCTPGVDIGLFCSTPMVALTRAVPRKRAMEMLLTGDMIDAETAAAWGLVNNVVPAGEAREAALELARRIAAKSPAAIAFGKRAFEAQMGKPLEDAYRIAACVMVENLLSEDAEEGIEAFLEKRPPTWEGQ